MRFEKWQALGNDYLIVERDRVELLDARDLDRALRIAHRDVLERPLAPTRDEGPAAVRVSRRVLLGACPRAAHVDGAAGR